MRFPEFSGEWEKTSIGECFSKVENGLTYDTDNTSGVPVTRIETISDKSINYDRVGYANIDDKISKYEMQYGDVLFSHINSLKHIGKTAFYDAAQPLYHGMNLILLRAKKSLDSKFLYYTLNTHKFLHRCQVLANQAVNQASINTKELKSINISVPQMQEQQKISGLISLLDERIETQRKIIEDLKKLKDAISFILFTSKTCDKWELSNLATIVMGQSPSSQCYNTDNDGLPLIQGNLDITKGKLTPRLYSSEMTKKCHTGDVILTVRAPVGEVAIADFDACIGRGVCAIRPFNNNYSVLIYQFLQHYKPKWISLEQGSTFTSVSRNDIMSIKIGVSSIQAIEILNILDDKISIEDVILNNLNSQKNYLLAQMFI
ncbi:MAG: hypothetical protein E7066_10910 [Lentimicrobiaceae bacterium]|nr:hypothetical protein [Lentimicrobiaceae bacterium]